MCVQLPLCSQGLLRARSIMSPGEDAAHSPSSHDEFGSVSSAAENDETRSSLVGSGDEDTADEREELLDLTIYSNPCAEVKGNLHPDFAGLTLAATDSDVVRSSMPLLLSSLARSPCMRVN